MKLGKYVTAVMPVARSQICTAGVFQVNCGTDMTIQVDGKCDFSIFDILCRSAVQRQLTVEFYASEPQMFVGFPLTGSDALF